MQSLRHAEPSARLVVIATDGPIPQLEPLAEVILAERLDAPFRAMSVYYDALELNTAVKPYAFRSLLAEANTVTYLDPDIYVFQPLNAVRAALAEAELALTPHLTRPLLGEAMPNDQAILKSGVWNLGFAAMRATPATRSLVDWWAEKCRFDCRVDFENGLFTDQRWMDLAPGFVERFALLRSPTLNLAYWNLEGRTLARMKDGWTVDGQPLSFFHFSGFDPARPEVLSKHQVRTHVASGSPLATLLADYAKSLRANGYAHATQIEYGHGRFPSGEPVSKVMRRRALAAARAGEDFDDGLSARTEANLRWAQSGIHRDPDPSAEIPSSDVIAWLRGADADGRPRALTTLLDSRADLRERFSADAGGLLAWALGVEAPAGRFDPELLPPAVLSDPDVALRAAAFAFPDASKLEQRLAAAFGLAKRGRWPDALVRPLRTPFLAQALGRPTPFPRLFEEIWQSRSDLQRLFPLRTAYQRFRFFRWLVGGGLAGYHVDVDQLPSHPLLKLASISVGNTRAPSAAPAAAAELWVLDDPDAALEAAADRLVFEASSGRFLGPSGGVETPGRVALVRFLTPRALNAADAMALQAHGVQWDREELSAR